MNYRLTDYLLAVFPAVPAGSLVNHFTTNVFVPIAVALIAASPGLLTIRNGRRRKNEHATLESRVDRLEAKVDLLVAAIIPSAQSDDEEQTLRRVK